MMNRRSLVRLGLSTSALGLGMALPRLGSVALGRDADPHYLLQIFFAPGWDPSYLFDARPKAMTTAGIAHSYLEGEPVPLVDPRGGRTLVTSLFDTLRPHFEARRFSIVNGVHMAVGFDGHEQNLNYALTGNPFGGDALMPVINAGLDATPLDYLLVGDLYGSVIANGSRGVKLDARSGAQLVQAVRGLGAVNPADPTYGFVVDRLRAAQGGGGALSRGSRLMEEGLAASGDLGERLKRLELQAPPSGDVPLAMLLNFAHQSFLHGVSRTVVLEFDEGDMDCHDVDSAKKQPELYRDVAAKIAEVFEYLSSTPLATGDRRSLLDCTTVVITSEFARTLRQPQARIDETGTDHNPGGNTVIVGGKGFRGGLVVGATDIDAVDAAISPAHLAIDMEKLKTLGKPFDFTTGMPTAALPAVYESKDYLTYASVANTVFDMFGVPVAKQWTLGRNGPRAPTLLSLRSPSS